MPRTRIVVFINTISMLDSGDDDTRDVTADTVLTGTSETSVPGPADLPPGPYCSIQRRSRFALMPLASAVLATDTPGRKQLCTSARLAATLYVRLPPGGVGAPAKAPERRRRGRRLGPI
jgi:hypothetical protein